MKINRKKILQMTRSVLRGEKRYGEHLLLHPIREWGLGLLCFMVLCAGGAWWAASVYLRYMDISTSSGDGVVPEITKYRGEHAAKAIDILKQRASEYDTIMDQYDSAVVSPVIIPEVSVTEMGTSTPDTDATTTQEIQATPSPIAPQASLNDAAQSDAQVGVPELAL